MRAVRGTARLDGQPLARQPVSLISPAMDSLWGTAETGDDGSFEIATPQAATDGAAHLLVRVKSPVIGILHRTVSDAGPADLDAATGDGFFEFAATVENGSPPALVLRIDPVAVAGVPDGLERFFKQAGPGVHESTFATVPADGDRVTATLRAGSYKLAADAINYDRPQIVDPDFDNYIASALRVGGRDAPGDEYGGFIVELSSDVSAEIVLRVLDNREL